MSSIAVLPAVRFVKGAAATISHQFTDSDGEPAAPPAGTLAVAVTRSNGDAVTSGAVAGTGSSPRTTLVGVAEMLQTDWLTATWTLDGDVLAVDVVEVCGGTLGTVAELRATDANLTAEEAASLRAKRKVVEDMSLAILGRAVFERFAVERLPVVRFGGHIFLSFPDVYEIAWVRTWSGTTTYDLTDDELGDLVVADSGFMSPNKAWPYGGTVEVGYRFGMRSCPGDLLEALRKSVRHAFNNFDSGVPAFAASMQTNDGFNFGIAGPGNENWATGDISIDRVVNRYKYRPLVSP
jgi:hypothetical protein